MLFHLDENVDHAIARALRQRGIDVTTSTEIGLIGADDLLQLDFARKSSRVIVTQDADFLRHHQVGVPSFGNCLRFIRELWDRRNCSVSLSVE